MDGITRRAVGGVVAAIGAAVALAVPLAACGEDGGDDGARGTAQKLSAPVGEPLPPELLGSWYERTKGDDTTWRTSLLAAGHKVCLEVVETRGNCYFSEAAEGGALLEADDLGQPRMVGYGEIGLSGEELVFRAGDSPDEECDGSRHTAAWRLRGERLVIEPSGPVCGPGPPGPVRLDRAG